jgi:hypothetical protein
VARSLFPVDPPERSPARVLLVHAGELPAATATSTLTDQVAEALTTANCDVDVLTLKGQRHGHIERVGGARVLRVPVASTDRAGFQRALQRQLQACDYHAVIAVDSTAWSVLPTELGPRAMVTLTSQDPLVHQLQRGPSGTPAAGTLYPRAWAAPSRFVSPSRTLARAFSSIVDPRTVTVIRRGVDVTRFKPPSIDMGVDELHLIIFGGRNDVRMAASVMKMLPSLRRSAERVVVLGAPGPGDEVLHRAGLVLVDIDDRHQLPQQLSVSNVVMVVSDGQDGALPYRMLESLACRRPTVLVGAPSLDRDVVASGQLTLSSYGDDISALLQRLRDPVVHERAARSGHRYVHDRANFATLANDWRALVWETIGREPPSMTTDHSSIAQPRMRPPPTDAEATGSGPAGEMPAPFPAEPQRRDKAKRDGIPARAGIVAAAPTTDPWVGDTIQSGAAAAVNRIMLRTESGASARPVPKSLQFVDVVEGPSPWTSDTIADGAPVPRSDSERRVVPITETSQTVEQTRRGRVGPDTTPASDVAKPKRRR